MKLYYERETSSFLKRLFRQKPKRVNKFGKFITSIVIDDIGSPVIFKNGSSDITEDLIEQAEIKWN